MTLTVPTDIEKRIAALAKDTGRNPDIMTADALRAYVAREERIVASIRDGIAAADRGELVPHEQVVAGLDAIIADAEARLKADSR